MSEGLGKDRVANLYYSFSIFQLGYFATKRKFLNVDKFKDNVNKDIIMFW